MNKINLDGTDIYSPVKCEHNFVMYDEWEKTCIKCGKFEK